MARRRAAALVSTALLFLSISPPPAAADDDPDSRPPSAADSVLAGEPESTDLIDQFPPQIRGGQIPGTLGDGHVYAALALLEAACFRHFGKHRLLSSTDLFLHKTLLDFSEDPAALRAATRFVRSLVDVDEPAAEPSVLAGSGPAVDDIRYALKRGAAAQEDMPYWPFYSGYRDGSLMKFGRDSIRDDKSEPLDKIVAHVDALFPRAKASREETRRTFALEKIGLVCEGAGRDPCVREFRTQWKAQEGPGAGGDDAGFHAVVVRTVKSSELSKEACLEHDEGRGALLLQELLAHRPVAVSMDLAGLDAWGEKLNVAAAFHEFVIRGYELGEDDQGRRRVSFQTLSSWTNGDSPPVGDDELCRIRGVVSVR